MNCFRSSKSPVYLGRGGSFYSTVCITVRCSDPNWSQKNHISSNVISQLIISFIPSFFPPAADITVCEFEGRTHPVGSSYASEDCSLRCRCTGEGKTVCGPMQCRRGLQRKGTCGMQDGFISLFVKIRETKRPARQQI